MHNWPGRPRGSYAIRPGPFFAATDQFDITIQGQGGHAAKPHETVDSVVVAAQVVMALQTIVSRNTDPGEQAVVSLTSIESNSKAFNVIAQSVQLKGTIRTLTPELRALAEERFRKIVTATCDAHGAEAKITYYKGYPPMVNHPDQTDFAAKVATDVAGSCDEAPLIMGGEDFAYMLEERPGAYILGGNGDTAAVHNAAYNFSDEAIPAGCSWWAEIVEQRMPAA
jgi:hippurate hydrolase